MPIDFSNPETIQELKTAGYLSGDEVTQKLQDSNKALETNKNDILQQLKDTKDRYSGVDVEAWNKLNEDSRFKQVISSGFDDYERGLGGELQERLNASRSDMMIKEQEYQRYKDQSEEKLTTFERQLMQSELKRKLGMALVRNDKVDPLATDEIFRDAIDQLALDEKGDIVVMGADGIPKQTAEGPMRENDWLTEMMKSKPYRFRGASGGGNSVTDGIAGVDLDKLSPAEKMRLARQQRRA